MAAGVMAVAAFLIAGQFMRYHTPPLATLGDSVRLMFRSRHIYIVLVVAFTVEPARGFHEEMRWSAAGLFALFLGSMVHPVCGPLPSEKLLPGR